MIALILPQVNRYTRPLFQLNETMQRVGQGDLTIRSDIRTDDEVGALSDGFNRMIQSLNSYINQLLEKEKTEQHMKYSLLISQIDPHFIYNTMNSINYLARKQRNPVSYTHLADSPLVSFDAFASSLDPPPHPASIPVANMALKTNDITFFIFFPPNSF